MNVNKCYLVVHSFLCSGHSVPILFLTTFKKPFIADRFDTQTIIYWSYSSEPVFFFCFVFCWVFFWGGVSLLRIFRILIQTKTV